MLTGEAAPVMKAALPMDQPGPLRPDTEKDKKCVGEGS
jgi:hypothetical protein